MQLTTDTDLPEGMFELFKLTSLEDLREASSETEEGLTFIALDETKALGLDVTKHGNHFLFFKDSATMEHYIDSSVKDALEAFAVRFLAEVRLIIPERIDAFAQRCFDTERTKPVRVFFIRLSAEHLLAHARHDAAASRVN